jgi:hypothetical protein
MFGKKSKQDEKIERLEALVKQLTDPDPTISYRVDTQHLDYATLKRFIVEAQNTGNIQIRFVDGTVINLEGYRPQIGFKTPKDHGYYD